MNETKRLIFKVDRLKKNYGSLEAINVKKLEIHPGTIYAIVGPPGSGKTTLLDILSGSRKQSSGELYFENETYKTNWFGKIIKQDEIFYNYGFDDYGTGSSVGKIINKMYGKKSNTIMKRHFNSPRFKHLWDRSISSLTKGELHWVGMVLSLESDPRVLLIDEYGVHITNDMEQEFRTQLKRMNRTLGTTIILSSPNEALVQNFASVIIFMDNGHISKIWSKSNWIGGPRRPGRKGHFNHKKNNIKSKGSGNKPTVNRQSSQSSQGSENQSSGTSRRPSGNRKTSQPNQGSRNQSTGSNRKPTVNRQSSQSSQGSENQPSDTSSRPSGNRQTSPKDKDSNNRLSGNSRSSQSDQGSRNKPPSSKASPKNQSSSANVQTSASKDSVSSSSSRVTPETPKPPRSKASSKNQSSSANVQTSTSKESVPKPSQSQAKE